MLPSVDGGRPAAVDRRVRLLLWRPPLEGQFATTRAHSECSLSLTCLCRSSFPSGVVEQQVPRGFGPLHRRLCFGRPSPGLSGPRPDCTGIWLGQRRRPVARERLRRSGRGLRFPRRPSRPGVDQLCEGASTQTWTQLLRGKWPVRSRRFFVVLFLGC